MMAYRGIYQFGGYDARRAAGDGAIRDMKNMSLRRYPAASPREARRYYSVGGYQDLQGAYFGDRDFIVAGGVFYDGGTAVFDVDEGDKQLAALGDLLYIFPDKIVYDTKSQTYEDLGAAEMVFSDESEITSGVYHYTRLEIVRNGDLYNQLRIREDHTRVMFSAGELIEIDSGERQYILRIDAREDTEDDGEQYVTLTFSDGALRELWGNHVDTDLVAYVAATLRYTIPDMDFVFASDNRLWGARGREIYASSLGDGRTWKDYDTLADASWAATTATGDTITAACDFSGMPVFFCENAIYKIYGESPGEYQYVRSPSIGVMAGEHRSVAVGGGYVFYLSRRGVCSYTGGIPQVISAPLGETRLKNGVGGTDGVVYYLSVPEPGRQSLLAFDTRHSLWTREDDTDAVYIGMRGRNLCCIDREGSLFAVGDVWDDGGVTENGFTWYLETAVSGDGSVKRKSAAHLLIEYEADGEASVLISRDGEPWHEAGRLYATDGYRITSVIGLHPGQYRTQRIRLCGKGDITVYYMVREVTECAERPGGENNVYL